MIMCLWDGKEETSRCLSEMGGEDNSGEVSIESENEE